MAPMSDDIPTTVIDSTDLREGDSVKVKGGWWHVKRIEHNGRVTFHGIDQAREVPARVRIAKRPEA